MPLLWESKFRRSESLGGFANARGLLTSLAESGESVGPTEAKFKGFKGLMNAGACIFAVLSVVHLVFDTCRAVNRLPLSDFLLVHSTEKLTRYVF